MPEQELSFVIDVTPREVNGLELTPEHKVMEKALDVFGEGVKFVCFSKQRSGTIRFLRKRGMQVIKKGGKFYLAHDTNNRLVWARLDIPLDYYIKQQGGTPGDVDLTMMDSPE